MCFSGTRDDEEDDDYVDDKEENIHNYIWHTLYEYDITLHPIIQKQYFKPIITFSQLKWGHLNNLFKGTKQTSSVAKIQSSSPFFFQLGSLYRARMLPVYS